MHHFWYYKLIIYFCKGGTISGETGLSNICESEHHHSDQENPPSDKKSPDTEVTEKKINDSLVLFSLDNSLVISHIDSLFQVLLVSLFYLPDVFCNLKTCLHIFP